VKFDLNDDQRAIASTVDDLLSQKFPLRVVRSIIDDEPGGAASAEELHRALAEMGVFGLVVPEQHGGFGLELLDVAVVAERLGRSAVPGFFLGPVLAAYALRYGGSPAQQARWLPRLATGELRTAYAVCENEQWDAAQSGLGLDGQLCGHKDWVLDEGGDLDLLVVATSAGLTLVDGDTVGLRRSPLNGIDLTRKVAAVALDGVAHEPLAGGAELARRIGHAARVLLAADAYGGAARCVELAVDYAQTREQFGGPIGSFQAVKHQLADMDLAVEPAQGLYWYAAHAFDHVPADAARFASLAKAHLTERYVEVARRLVEVYGGFGFTWECDAHVFLKRALLDRAQFGSPRGLRAEIAANTVW
jgi:alkylation response protein AidB-like acyl-CoA dehydrogenase